MNQELQSIQINQQIIIELLQSLDSDIQERNDPFKTKDAKKIAETTRNCIMRYCNLGKTRKVFMHFAELEYPSELKQQFLYNLNKLQAISINYRKNPWKLPYSTITITEDEDTYLELKKRQLSSEYINNPSEIERLEGYDIVRTIYLDNCTAAAEQIENSIDITTLEEASSEKNLAILHSYIDIIEEILKNNDMQIIPQLYEDCKKLTPPLEILKKKKPPQKIEISKIREIIAKINADMLTWLSNQKLSGTAIIEVLNTKKLPYDIEQELRKKVQEQEIPYDLVSGSFPLEIDPEAAKEYAEKDSEAFYLKFEQDIQKQKQIIIEIPVIIQRIEKAIMVYDFLCGVSHYIHEQHAQSIIQSEYPVIKNAKNLFLKNPQEIDYHLDSNNSAALLTGANSGGKTTLLEHIIQIITVQKMGIPASGNNSMPDYKQIYYFSKSKGSTNKGAFETLLTQISSIECSSSTLVLADEMEAVTEPSVAASIIKSTVQYLVKNKCHVIFATHLGMMLAKELPDKTRIDGIEASGIDENNNLIVNHNPIIGRFARSTPELIIRRLAKKKKTEYLQSLLEELEVSI